MPGMMWRYYKPQGVKEVQLTFERATGRVEFVTVIFGSRKPAKWQDALALVGLPTQGAKAKRELIGKDQTGNVYGWTITGVPKTSVVSFDPKEPSIFLQF